MIQRVATWLSLAGTVAVLVVIAPRLGMVPDELALRVEVYSMVVFGLIAATISGSVMRFAPDRPGASEVALAMALFSLATMLSVVPWGVASVLHRAAFGVVWAAMFLQFLRFWTRFPTRMTRAATDALRRRPGTSLSQRAVRGSARLAHWTVWTWSGRITIALGAVGMSWAVVGLRVMEYNLLIPRVLVDLGPVGNLALLGTAVAIGLNALIIITAYQLADEAGRRRVLWMLLAHLVTTLFILFALCVQAARQMTGDGFFMWTEQALNTIYLPFTNLAFLGGYSVGIFYGGAFDIRPIIGRSTVYGSLLMSITLVFAAVEEVAEELLVSRAGLPDGAGTLIGAGAVAILLGPIRDRLEVWLQRVTGWSPERVRKTNPEASP